jgi:hypothetical protein
VLFAGGTWVSIEVLNASGDYTILLAEPRDEEYWLSIQYDDGEAVEAYEFAGFIHSKESQFSISVNPNAVPRVTINRSPQPPIGLLARQSVAAPAMTTLSWRESSDSGVVSYNIYAKGEDEPHFTLIGATTEPEYDTGEAWVSDASIQTRIYVVAAADGAGSESFLSSPVRNVPIGRMDVVLGPSPGLPTTVEPRPRLRSPHGGAESPAG